jgi:hypothetical protein
MDASPVVTPDTTPPPEGVAYPSGAVAAKPTGPAAGAAAPAPPALPDLPPEGALGRALLCLKAEARTAAQAEASTKLAVDLLVEDLCAPQMARAALYQRNLEALARFTPQSERGRAGLSTARVDPETGEIVNPPDVDAVAASDLWSGPAAPPILRRAAATLVLAAKVRPAAPPRKAR